MTEKVKELSRANNYSENVSKSVSRILSDKAEGTFLWVGIACKELADIRSRDAVKALEGFPRGLNSLYTKLLTTALETEGKDKKTILDLLGCVTVSRRPLTLLELAAACRLYDSQDEQDRINFISEDIEMCRFMIVVQDESAHLLHKSVKDFLLHAQGGSLMNIQRANALLAYRCIDYVLCHMQLLNFHEKKVQSPMFIRYAVLYWPEHASLAKSEFHISPSHSTFFQPISSQREVWLKAYNHEQHSTSTREDFSILHVAAAWGILSLLNFVLDHVSFASIPQPFQRILNFLPASKAVKRCIASLADWNRTRMLINARDRTGKTPLHLAITQRQTEFVEALLEYGADVDLCDDELKCALHFAAELGSEQVVSMLLGISQKLEAQDCEGQTPLLCAVENLQAGSVYTLVKAGAQAKVINDKHQNTLHLICRGAKRKDSFTLLRYFINQGLSPYACDVDNMTPLFYALGNRHEDLALHLLEEGLDVNSRIQRRLWVTQMNNLCTSWEVDEDFDPQNIGENSVTGLTALHFSAVNGLTEMVELLLDHDANPSALDDNGDTPLHLAIRSRIRGHKYGDPWVTGEYAVEENFISDWESEEVTELLGYIDRARERTVQILVRNNKIDVEVSNNHSECPIHVIPYDKRYACAVLSTLIEYGAQVSSLNSKQQTCLHLASMAGNLKAFRILVNAGCDITLLDSNHLSPLHHAVRGNRLDVLRFMFKSHENQTSHFCTRKIYLRKELLHHHVEAKSCSPEMIEILLAHGCDINKLDDNGNSVPSLDLTSSHFEIHHDVVQYILSH
ncbi:hypothetical protein N7523_007502 [Penicillium sp. IBT 18751x]|nr:hypothetical protein N7523_007502 [Penicillium sp. IBT 18751x]